MTPNQSETIKQRYRDALALKCDPEISDALLAIRKRAKQLDIPESEMRTLYLEVLNEKTKPEVKAEKEIPPPEPIAPEPKRDIPKEQTMRHNQTFVAQAGYSESGVKKSGASGGKSIVDGIL